jgi:hypothetical protein
MVLGEGASALPSDLAHTVIQAGVTFLIDVLARADVRPRVCWIGTCAFSSWLGLVPHASQVHNVFPTYQIELGRGKDGRVGEGLVSVL